MTGETNISLSLTTSLPAPSFFEQLIGGHHLFRLDLLTNGLQIFDVAMKSVALATTDF